MARWRIAGLVFAAVLAGCGWYILTRQPVYRASLQILLPASEVEDPGDRKNVQSMQADALVVRSYADVVQDEGLIRRVIKEQSLAGRPEFGCRKSGTGDYFERWKSLLVERMHLGGNGGQGLADDGVVQGYKSRLLATNDGKSLILTLSFDACDPALSSRIVNAHALTLLSQQVERRRDEARVKIAWMKAELDAAAEDLRTAQNAVQLHNSAAVTTTSAAAEQISDLKYRQILASSKESVYESLLTRYQNALAEERFTGSGLRILSPAEPPARPNYPKKALMLAVAGVLAFIAGVLAAFAALLVAGETRRLAAMRLGLPVLGKVNLPRPALLARMRQLQRAVFWDQISSVYGALGCARPNGTALAIVSSSQGEGKSITAAGLARAAAVGGARVVLVDGNVRRPRFRLAAGGHNLLTALQDATRLGECVIRADPALPLHILPAPIRPIDAALLSGPKINDLMARLRSDYDLILFDTPDIGAFSDALAIGNVVDGVVLVAIEGAATAPFRSVVEKLGSRGVPIRGVVFTEKRRVARKLLAALRPYLSNAQPPEIWPDPNIADQAQVLDRPPPRDRPRLPSTAAGPSLVREA